MAKYAIEHKTNAGEGYLMRQIKGVAAVEVLGVIICLCVGMYSNMASTEKWTSPE